MRLLHGKPSFSAFWNSTGNVQDHLRISEVSQANDDSVDEGAGSPCAGQAIAPRLGDGSVRPEVLQGKYDRSVERIESCIYALATAVSALGSVEDKLIEARGQIETLQRRGTPVDGAKVHRTLTQLADHVNTTIAAMDRHGVNLLRDSRVAITLTEIDDGEEREVGIELTLIALDKLMAYQLRNGTLEEDEAIEVIDGFASIVFNNVQVLSSAILALLASRDYTDEVTKLVLTEGISRQPREFASRKFATDIDGSDSPSCFADLERAAGEARPFSWQDQIECEAGDAASVDAPLRARSSLVALIDRLKEGSRGAAE